jgi:hypothetical protein
MKLIKIKKHEVAPKDIKHSDKIKKSDQGENK